MNKAKLPASPNHTLINRTALSATAANQPSRGSADMHILFFSLISHRTEVVWGIGENSITKKRTLRHIAAAFDTALFTNHQVSKDVFSFGLYHGK